MTKMRSNKRGRISAVFGSVEEKTLPRLPITSPKGFAIHVFDTFIVKTLKTVYGHDGRIGVFRAVQSNGTESYVFETKI